MSITDGSVYECVQLKMKCKALYNREEQKLRMLAPPRKGGKIENDVNENWQ